MLHECPQRGSSTVARQSCDVICKSSTGNEMRQSVFSVYVYVSRPNSSSSKRSPFCLQLTTSGVAKGGARGGARGGGARAPWKTLCPPVCPPIWDLWCKILHLSLSSGAPPHQTAVPPPPPPRIKSLVTPLAVTWLFNHPCMFNYVILYSCNTSWIKQNSKTSY